MARMWTLVLFCLLWLALLGIGTAEAGGHARICNKGNIDVLVAEIDWYGLINPNPTISGWYALPVGQCYEKNGLGVDVTLAFTIKKHVFDQYFYFDVPTLQNSNPFSIAPNYSTKVRMSQRQACVSDGVFERTVTESQLEDCPAGWQKIQFNWAVSVLPGYQGDDSVSLEIRPYADGIKTYQGRSEPQATMAPAPSVYPAGTIFGRFPARSYLESTPVIRRPDDAWRSMVDNKEVAPVFVDAIAKKIAVEKSEEELASLSFSTDSKACHGVPPIEFSLRMEAIQKTVQGIRSVSLANVDANRLTIVPDDQCDVYQIPCRNDAQCVVVYNGDGTTATDSHVDFGMKNDPPGSWSGAEQDKLVKMLHTMSDLVAQ